MKYCGDLAAKDHANIHKGAMMSEGTAAKSTAKLPPGDWVFSAEILANTASIRAGLSPEKELLYRQQCANHIQEMGTKLTLSQLCMNTALVFMHRFYVFHSFHRFSRNDIAASALFLAAKVEECPRKLEFVVKVSHALQNRDNPGLDVKTDKYAEEAQNIVTLENILLQTLGFDVHVEHPHPYVVRCCQMIKAPRELAQTAYYFATDSLHLSTFCLRYRPAVVACICIHLACSWAKWEIPMSQEHMPWYSYMEHSLTKEKLEALAHEFACICEKAPDRWKLRRFVTKKEPGAAAGAASGSLPSAGLHPKPPPPNDVPPIKVEKDGESLAKAPVAVTSKQEQQQENGGVPLGQPNVTRKLDRLTEVVGRREQLVSQTVSPRKVKSESPNVIDLKCYKERREKEKEVAAAGRSNPDGAESVVTHRKSFIPDMSLKPPGLFTEFTKNNPFDPHSYSASAPKLPPVSMPPSTAHPSSHAPAAVFVDVSRKRPSSAMTSSGSSLSSGAPRPKMHRDDLERSGSAGSMAVNNKSGSYKPKAIDRPVTDQERRNSSLKSVSRDQAAAGHSRDHPPMPPPPAVHLDQSRHAAIRHELSFGHGGGSSGVVQSSCANSSIATAASSAAKKIDKSTHTRSSRSTTSDRRSRTDSAVYPGKPTFNSSSDKHKPKTHGVVPDSGHKDSHSKSSKAAFALRHDQLERALLLAVNMQMNQTGQPPASASSVPLQPLVRVMEKSDGVGGNPERPPLPPEEQVQPPPPPPPP